MCTILLKLRCAVVVTSGFFAAGVLNDVMVRRGINVLHDDLLLPVMVVEELSTSRDAYYSLYARREQIVMQPTASTWECVITFRVIPLPLLRSGKLDHPPHQRSCVSSMPASFVAPSYSWFGCAHGRRRCHTRVRFVNFLISQVDDCHAE